MFYRLQVIFDFKEMDGNLLCKINNKCEKKRVIFAVLDCANVFIFWFGDCNAFGIFSNFRYEKCLQSNRYCELNTLLT